MGKPTFRPIFRQALEGTNLVVLGRQLHLHRHRFFLQLLYLFLEGQYLAGFLLFDSFGLLGRRTSAMRLAILFCLIQSELSLAWHLFRRLALLSFRLGPRLHKMSLRRFSFGLPLLWRYLICVFALFLENIFEFGALAGLIY